jgi:hypothetical protein
MRTLWITTVVFAASCSGAFSQEALSTAAAQRRLQAYVNTLCRSGDLLREADVAAASSARQATLHRRLAGAPLPDRAGHSLRRLRSSTNCVPSIRNYGLAPPRRKRQNLCRERAADPDLVERERRQDCSGISASKTSIPFIVIGPAPRGTRPAFFSHARRPGPH